MICMLSRIGDVLWSFVFVCAAIAAILVLILLIQEHLDKKNGVSKRRHMSKEKRRAMYPSPPRRLLSRHPSGLTIGTYKGKYVNLPFQQSPLHILGVGEPGVGKSSTLENAILAGLNFADEEHSGYYKSVLAVDSKPELARKGVDESRDDVKIVNPSSLTGCGFDAMYGITKDSSDDELKVRCRQIARALIPDQHGDNSYFSSSAQNILTGALMYGFRKALGFIETISKVKSVKTLDLIAEIMSDPDMDDHPKIKAMVAMYEDNDSDEFASISDTLGKDLDIFQTDSVKHCFSENNPDRATPQDLIDGISIFLAIPDTLIDDYSRVFGMILEICIRYLMAQDEFEIQNEKPVFVLADESSSIFIPSLSSALARARSKGVCICTLGQSVKAFRARYGRETFDGMMECCSIKLIFSCSDPEIAKGFSESCGQFEEKKRSYTKQGTYGVSSSNTSSQWRNCVEVSDIIGLPDRDELLVFYKGTWFIAKKSPYFKISEYNQKSKELFQKNYEYERRIK